MSWTEQRSCLWCSEPFEPRNDMQLLCGRRHLMGCVVCGTVFEAIPHRGRAKKPTCCSRRCGVQLRPTPEPKPKVPKPSTMFTRGLRHPIQQGPPRMSKKRRVVAFIPCGECGTVFFNESASKPQRYCSDECRAARKLRMAVHNGDRGSYRRRARHYGVRYVPGITRLKVLERDGWICDICSEPIEDLAWEPGLMAYGTLDHRRPLAVGGAHDWPNVRAAHLGCNMGAQVEQLRRWREILAHAERRKAAGLEPSILTEIGS